jgi:hypothetical protein
VRWAAALLIGALLLVASAAAAFAQTDTPTPTVTAEPDTQFDPGETTTESGTEAEQPTTDEPIDAEEAESTEETEVSDETIQQAGWGNAANQTTEAKEAEAEQDCAAGAAPPISRMLGVPGFVSGDEGGGLGSLVLVIAAGALVVAGIAFALRHRKHTPQPRGSLETVATVVGILGAVAGLAVQFVPGVGARETPAAAASMAVNDVNARITHVEYARKTNAELPETREDRREVGNVIWLEVHLEGFRDENLFIQYGLYDPQAGGALLPGTAKRVPLPVDPDSDQETRFVPIWVGYPLSEKFVAGFRLLHGDQVQAMAATGHMRSSQYRYSCP